MRARRPENAIALEIVDTTEKKRHDVMDMVFARIEIRIERRPPLCLDARALLFALIAFFLFHAREKPLVGRRQQTAPAQGIQAGAVVVLFWRGGGFFFLVFVLLF